MNFKLLLLIFLIGSGSISLITEQQPEILDCHYKNIKLYGKVQFVESFPDFKIKIVEDFPDLRVQIVQSFPDNCGKWQVVEEFPDFKVQIVESFPDFKIQYVESFPGKP